MKFPRNETKEHFLLKEIARYILFGWGYNKVATEVGGMWTRENKEKDNDKCIIDTVGVKTVNHHHKGVTTVEYDIKGIEAKASLADFRNGFCSAPMYTYIIAPKGIIPIDQIPDKIGFIEVDLNNIIINKRDFNISSMEGVELAKRARKNLDKRFKNEAEYRKWCATTLERVAYRATTEMLFKRNFIELNKNLCDSRLFVRGDQCARD